MKENNQNHLDSLLAELKRIELKLEQQVRNFRTEARKSGRDNFSGMYITESEVDEIISSPPIIIDEALLSRGESAGPVFDTRQKDGSLIHNLACLFRLSDFELDALLVCLLPELDLRYQKLYGYLQDDITRKSPTVDLLMRLLLESFEQRQMARQSFLPEAPLMKYHLLRLFDESTTRHTPLLARSATVDERVTAYLLGIIQVDVRILPFTRLVRPGLRMQEMVVSDNITERLVRLAGRYEKEGCIGYFRGGSGVGKKSTAEALCVEMGVPLLVVDVERMMIADIPMDLLVPLVFREGRLHGAALYFRGFDTLLGEGNEMRSSYDAVIRELVSYPGWAFLSGEHDWEPGGSMSGRYFVNIEFPLPSFEERIRLWEKNRNGHGLLADDIDLNDIAGKFRLSGGQIIDAVAMARNIALWRDPEGGKVTTDDLYIACRQKSRHNLSALASKIIPKYKWGDIVLPKDQMEQLHDICNYVEHYHTVYTGWGFDRKLSLGKGLNVLFVGQSGTGKTMAAEIIASELGLDIYKIDLSMVVSKYIGETEKNLDRIFQEGRTSNAILFFDEADALFGKRSEVRDSHDRYANIEIAYLLQKMDEYDGVVVLSTNLGKNMDEAFTRRMHFSLEFPLPEAPDRFRIWKGVFPVEAPLNDDADLQFMASQFKITGGNIKNIAIGAAFLAAEDGGHIDTEKLIRATKREYQKMGRLCTQSEFGRYFELVRG